MKHRLQMTEKSESNHYGLYPPHCDLQLPCSCWFDLCPHVPRVQHCIQEEKVSQHIRLQETTPSLRQGIIYAAVTLGDASEHVHAVAYIANH